MPRVKSDAERGVVGAWMRRERMAREWSPEQVVAELAKRGEPIRVDYYRGVEAGKKPGSGLLQTLMTIYGSEPAPPSTPAAEAVGGNPDLAAAIRDLVEEVRLSRLSSERSADVLAQLLAVVIEGASSRTESADDAHVRPGTR